MNGLLRLGIVSGTHHLKGAVKVNSVFENEELLIGKKVMCRKKNGENILLNVTSAYRMNQKKMVLEFEGINVHYEAKNLLDAELLIHKDMLPELKDSEYYLSDMIGMTVISIEGELLGLIEEIMSTGAHDILVINKDKANEILLPDVDEFIKNIDFEKREITVKLIEGIK